MILAVRWPILILFFSLVIDLRAQNATFPLESVALEGTSLPKETILDLAGMDENEIWRWLTARYPRFDRRVAAKRRRAVVYGEDRGAASRQQARRPAHRSASGDGLGAQQNHRLVSAGSLATPNTLVHLFVAFRVTFVCPMVNVQLALSRSFSKHIHLTSTFRTLDRSRASFSRPR